MSTRPVDRTAWGLVALALAVTVAAGVTASISGRFEPGSDSLLWSISLVFAAAGHVIATRQPANVIGWMFLLVAVSAALAQLTGAYAELWVGSASGPRALGELALAYRNVSWIPFILVPATFLLLLFPDGHLLSRRWRPAAWCAAAGIASGFVTMMLTPGPLDDFPELDNPYGIENAFLDMVRNASIIVTMLGILASAASLMMRFQLARGEQRQQMKWIALAGAIGAVTIPAMFLSYEVVGQAAADRTIMLSILALPTATALAIVRYRLYDIDLVINRALVYGSLTGILAGTYVGTVLLLQLALSGITEGSGLAVAASTLTVAALFRPVRARIQQGVDRRFFRSQYDAALIVEAFGARLRDEVDLSNLSADLVEAVQSTVQPSHASLWLRPETP
jgi:hypothetical protein